MTEKYISLDDVMTIIARKHLFKDKTDFDKCVHAIAEQVKALPPVEAVPLSVIEKITTEIEERATYEGIYLDRADVLEIIDKAVKECTHDKG